MSNPLHYILNITKAERYKKILMIGFNDLNCTDCTQTFHTIVQMALQALHFKTPAEIFSKSVFGTTGTQTENMDGMRDP